MKEKIIQEIRRKINYVRRKIVPGSLILMYHRIAEARTDPWELCVSPKHFAEHLEVIRQIAAPLSLQQLNHRIKHKRPFSKTITITFDDGYADNLFHAKPLLEKYDIPATVFVVSGGLDNPREFWWDELERLILLPGTLPQFLRLDIHGRSHQWDLGEFATYSEAEHQRYCLWRADLQAPPTSRHTLYRALHRLIQPLFQTEQRLILDQIQSWSGSAPHTRSDYRSLTKTELVQLAAGGIVEIGAHTVTHPLLSAIPPDTQQAEIKQSKQELEAILGYPINSFSYPFGNYTPKTVSLVKELGFNCACSCIPTTVWPFSDCLKLPRITALNWDGEQFAEQIASWLEV